MKREIFVNYRDKKFFLNNINDFNSLNSKGFGFIDGNFYFLDIYEVLYLKEKEKIRILKGNKELNLDDLMKLKFFSLKKYLVYKNLVFSGYNVKSGLKFGFDFRIYHKNSQEKHSLWLVDVVKYTESIKFKDLLGKSRIANTTNKKLIFAIIDEENSITYIENSWKKI